MYFKKKKNIIIKKVKKPIIKVLYRPYFAFLLCLLFLLLNLVWDGTLFSVFRLNRDLRIVKNRIEDIEKKNQDIQNKIQKVSDPDFVEKEVRQRLDYTGEGDLIFIFPDNI